MSFYLKFCSLSLFRHSCYKQIIKINHTLWSDEKTHDSILTLICGIVLPHVYRDCSGDMVQAWIDINIHFLYYHLNFIYAGSRVKKYEWQMVVYEYDILIPRSYPTKKKKSFHTLPNYMLKLVSRNWVLPTQVHVLINYPIQLKFMEKTKNKDFYIIFE